MTPQVPATQPDRTILHFSTPVHPTAIQARQFTDLIAQVAPCSPFQSRHRSSRAALDDRVIAVTDTLIHVGGVPHLVVADLWRLPLGLTAGLLASGHSTLRSVQSRLDQVQQADRLGHPPALLDLHSLAARFGLLLDFAPTASGVRQDRPHRAGHATLRRYRLPGGSPAWTIDWSIRVPAGWLPPASRHDVIGVDVGVHNLLSWADAASEGHLPSGPLPTGIWTPPLQPGDEGQRLLSAAVVRRAQFQRRAEGLSAVLRHLLSYRTVAIERTNWRGLARRGAAAELEAMSLTGVTEVLGWLERLAPVTGTRVISVPPGDTSHRCGACGQPGSRVGKSFVCSASGWEADADANAARYIRRVALGQGA